MKCASTAVRVRPLRRSFALGLWVVGLWLSLFGPAPALAAAPESAARLQTLLGELQTLRGRFDQTLTSPAGEELQRSDGEFAIKRPGYFYWRAGEPAPQTIVGTPDKLWVYDPDLEQATLRAQNPYSEFNPSQLLSGNADSLAEQFTVEHSRSKGIDNYVLTPRAADSHYQYIRLSFKGKRPRAMAFADKLNQVTAIEFAKVSYNKPVADEAFAFEPPEGTDIVVDGQ